MIQLLILFVFILGYMAIAFEHPLRLNKAASALITGVLCWTIFSFGEHAPDHVTGELFHHLSDISGILFFLLGAMAIVELIDSHGGFDIVTSNIRATDMRKLLYIIVLITFFLSALLDNLTTAIVMTSVSAKILTDRQDRLWFAGLIVIAANAGGAWSPMGDVSTTMLWTGGQITALNIIHQLILPSLTACLVPTIVAGFRFKGKKVPIAAPANFTRREMWHGRIVLFSGIGLLLFVPLFKTITHLPPFMGIVLALGLMWLITTILHKNTSIEHAEKYTVARALQKIDTPSILFFLGILLAVACLSSAGLLKEVANFLGRVSGNDYITGIILGLLSAIVDNVPLVAATQGMYNLAQYPIDHHFWEFLAFTTGTGGSALIIGSAAGVAVMGIENINFTWYLKKIGWLALLGFFAGVLVFLIQEVV